MFQGITVVLDQEGVDRDSGKQYKGTTLRIRHKRKREKVKASLNASFF